MECKLLPFALSGRRSQGGSQSEGVLLAVKNSVREKFAIKRRKTNRPNIKTKFAKIANLIYLTRISKPAYSTIQTDNQNRPPIPKRKNKIRIFANIKYHCACQTLQTTYAELYTHKNRQLQLLSLEFIPKLKQYELI